RQFFMQIPDSLIEAAIVDGYGYFHIYRKICLPIIKPGIIVYGIQTTIAAWNGFLWPMIVNSDPTKNTLPVAIQSFSGQYLVDTPLIMAASALSILPMILLYVLCQKYFTNIYL
ncbi:MAG: carbohydrate ABC transporter permease, partial [Bacilli bacterium]